MYWDRLPDELPPYAVCILLKGEYEKLLGPILAGEIALFIEKGYIRAILTDEGYSFKILRNPCEEDNIWEYQMQLFEWLFKDIAGEDGILTKEDFERTLEKVNDIRIESSGLFSNFIELTAKLRGDKTLGKLAVIGDTLRNTMKKKGYYEKDYELWFVIFEMLKLFVGIVVVVMASMGMEKIYYTPFILIFLVVEIGKIWLCVEDESKKLTNKGMISYKKWKSFKKFLQNYSKFEDRGIRDLAVWKEFLAYGTALDIADKLTSEVDDAGTILIAEEINRIMKKAIKTKLFDKILG